MTAPEQAAPGDAGLPWFRFKKGETALDFGAKYAFASDNNPRHFGIFWSHEAPADATWAVNLKDILNTIPAAIARAGE